MKGSLEKKRAFMVKFLHRKNYELGNRKVSQRTLKMDPQVVGKSNTTFKLNRGEKIFHTKVEDSEADDGDAVHDALPPIISYCAHKKGRTTYSQPRRRVRAAVRRKNL